MNVHQEGHQNIPSQRGQEFVALMYHGLVEDNPKDYEITFQMFQRQIQMLLEGGFTVESIKQLQGRLDASSPKKYLKLPDRYAVMTFDDGQPSDLRAAEALAQVGFGATFFLAQEFAEKNLGVPLIQRLAELADVGSHTVTHPHMTKISPEQLERELKESKNWLEQKTGQPIHAFSFPHGDINQTVVQQAFSMYQTLADSHEQLNSATKITQKPLLHRVAIRPSFSLSDFEKILIGDRRFFLQRRMRYRILQMLKGVCSTDQIRQLRRVIAQLELVK